MHSVSSSPTRREPQQERSERRLAGFLNVAAELIVEVGYEATTMTAIAERSGASIGGLYHYFPDKESVAIALMSRYGKELQGEWIRLAEQAVSISPEEFADLMLERVIDFIEERPAYLQLMAARIRGSRDPEARKTLRTLFAGALQSKNPALSDRKAMRAANVAIQIVKGMRDLYTEVDAEEKPAVATEFKEILASYLARVLAESA